MTTAFVQGASGGLGGALTQRLLRDPSVERVFATYRRPERAGELLAAREAYGERVIALQLDVTDDASLDRAAAGVAEHGLLDLVLNCSGVLSSERIRPEKRVSHLEREALLESFDVNAIGPLLTLRRLVEFLPRRERSVIANLSARVGSIGDNRLGGWYGYRSSKAALNMLTRCLAIELERSHPGCICVAIHPGTVDTELSRPFRSGRDAFSPDRAARQILDVLGGLTANQTGSFYAWDGNPIPW